MSLLGRFLGSGRSKASAEGAAHLENGRYAEAVDCLRVAALGESDTPSGSLASFRFRQALLREGRRLLRTEDKARAIPFFAEAVKLWDQYPDLHCLLGAAEGLTGDWETALAEGRSALRVNSDYAEARLLEAAALQALSRDREAADSLNHLVESGRRVDHWLINGLTEKGPFTPETLPADLPQLLERSVSGQSEIEEMASAVALCRAGKWEEGLKCFASLVERRPRYPDYRTRHAAALFQIGRNGKALSEVEAALALNETYRTAIDLKGLILAEEGRLKEAADFLRAADEKLRDAQAASAHEKLFAAYLRGVLALMTGRAASVRDVLGEWPDLARNFARAELLLAAADYLTGQTASCGRRLNVLVQEWSVEPVYFYLLACHHLAEDRFQDVADVLGRWPAVGGDGPDIRPLYLEQVVSVSQGRAPTIPAEAGLGPDTATIDQPVSGAAWAFLGARAEFLQGTDASSWRSCQKLVAQGLATEGILRLQTQAGAAATGEIDPDWQPGPVVPDSCLAAAVHYAVNRGRAEQAAALVASHRKVHPESLLGFCLDAAFWLNPIRNWIA